MTRPKPSSTTSPFISQQRRTLCENPSGDCRKKVDTFRVSNDNPFSESQFKTTKYQPDYPGRFDGMEHAQRWFRDYVHWYNHEHHHSGLAGYTPEQVFTGQDETLAEQKQRVLNAQYATHPERFVKGCPTVARPPASVSINPVQPEDENSTKSGSAVNFPTLPAAAHTGRKSTLTD